MGNETYPTREIKVLTAIEHMLARPKMYFGDGPTASIELAAFLNGYMTHRSGFMRGGFGICGGLHDGFGCMADPAKTIEENAATFRTKIETWEKNKVGEWRCCLDAPRPEKS